MKEKLKLKKSILENIKILDKGIGRDTEGRGPKGRYSSFDYCFNYFQLFKNKKEIANKKNIQNSCLHLAFYLASWGMLRGSSFLLQKSIKFYVPLINYFSRLDNSYWGIDIHNYSKNDNKNKIIEIGWNIKEILSDKNKNKVTETQITKIMLGVFGNVPAFDSYFKKATNLSIKTKTKKRELFEQSFKDALSLIENFYNKNKNDVNLICKKRKTLDFNTGKNTQIHYTRAKIIDMAFFSEGYENNKK